MPDLHRELAALTAEWPPTPDIAGAVEARLRAPAPAPRRRAWRPALAYGVALVLVVFVAVMAASPDARSSVLEWLGLKSVRLERREPTARPRSPGELGSRLGLGTPATLAAARSRRPFVSLPRAPGLGAPDAVYVGRTGVALVYGRRPGYVRAPHTGAALLVQELPAQVTPFIDKTLGGGTRVRRLRIAGDPAYFITGSHGFAYGGRGEASFEKPRLAGTTLLLERRDGLLLRIEGELSQAAAVRIARSIP